MHEFTHSSQPRDWFYYLHFAEKKRDSKRVNHLSKVIEPQVAELDSKLKYFDFRACILTLCPILIFYKLNCRLHCTNYTRKHKRCQVGMGWETECLWIPPNAKQPTFRHNLPLSIEQTGLVTTSDRQPGSPDVML